MLVLARKTDESIVIGENIVVKIISVENGVVKLGIDAPKEVSIIRNELIEEVKESNKAASLEEISENDIASLNKILGK
ncbi:carbon storage regulator CsrA [Sulfurimonas autotrophica]|uniref:Translational regulator CsrA n=1 Tax=Sulfurimonas autotrophica (strain ATCC BAA-671 / DSM 16294 / JCM 11897 / OK10) TaxID=563040 RepID=E0UQ70_SULAO|nr:carbon storage regulator CsrA [Sulfurimonas autotrophica]ADN09813.1 carbon storage regulator, CsrA [Sulfurimonas autotrophica DSM 16294]